MKDLSIKIGFAPTSLGSCISRGENLSKNAVGMICDALHCNIEDVVDSVPDGTQIVHKRTMVMTKRADENLVIVNWQELESDIKAAGQTFMGISLALNKASNFLTKKKKLKHTAITTLQEVARLINSDYRKYICSQ